MTGAQSLTARPLQESDTALPRPPRGKAAIDLKVLLDPDFSNAADAQRPPRLTINDQAVDLGYGRWHLEVPPGRVQISVEAAGRLSFTVHTPQRRIRRLDIWSRPSATEVPLAVHCPDKGVFKVPFILRMVAWVFLFLLTLRLLTALIW
ncbi:hypothetical protein ACQEU3_20805 [Spirillospora sp. CA-253888]